MMLCVDERRWETLRSLERPSQAAIELSCELVESWVVDVLNATVVDGTNEVSVFRIDSDMALSGDRVGLVLESLGIPMADGLSLVKSFADRAYAHDNDVMITRWHACSVHGLELMVVRK